MYTIHYDRNVNDAISTGGKIPIYHPGRNSNMPPQAGYMDLRAITRVQLEIF